jgi:hypothetical protein
MGAKSGKRVLALNTFTPEQRKELIHGYTEDIILK